MDPIEEAVAQTLARELHGRSSSDDPIDLKDVARAAITAHVAALEAAGYAVVPREPTEAILVAAGFGEPGSNPYLDAQSDYRDMVEAARLKQKSPSA